MALVTSEAALKQRCLEVSPDGSLYTSLAAQSIRSFRQLAFAIGTPRSEPTPEQYQELAAQVFGAAAPIGKVAQLRDLHFEATTYVIQALKDQVSSDAAEHQVRKLPMAERAARLSDQQRRLSGVSITGELQPSYGLIDKVNHILESGQLVWISPSMCGKRDLEVAQGIDHKAQVVQVEKEALKVSASQVETKADVTTPLMLHFAFQRRGIAFDQCGLIEWSTHQDYLHRLLFALSAPVPPGFSQVTIQQIVRADKELWTIMARECMPPFKAKPDGTKPLDVSMSKLMLDSRVQMWLLPVMASQASKLQAPPSVEPSDALPSDVPTPTKKLRLRKKAKKVMPDALKGCKKFSKGPCCWGFNLEGCSLETKAAEDTPSAIVDPGPDSRSRDCKSPDQGQRKVFQAVKRQRVDMPERGFVLCKPMLTAELSEDEAPGKCLTDMLVIEVCCSFDQKPKLRVHHLDLTDPEALRSLEELICTESA
ncbi:unnamed protein product, partial [Symbiodinium microadriaticum]